MKLFLVIQEKMNYLMNSKQEFMPSEGITLPKKQKVKKNSLKNKMNKKSKH